MNRTRRAWFAVAGLVGAGWLMLAPSSQAQFPSPPTFPPFTFPPPTMPPGFTIPSLPPPPTMPPPTSPPPTTPPPTMPPPTFPPPPTMPPPTSRPTIDEQIQSVIDKLEGFGDEFDQLIDQLRDLQSRF